MKDLNERLEHYLNEGIKDDLKKSIDKLVEKFKHKLDISNLFKIEDFEELKMEIKKF